MGSRGVLFRVAVAGAAALSVLASGPLASYADDIADAQARLQLTYRHKGRNEMVAWVERAKTEDGAALLCEVVAGWGEVEGPDGELAPYSEQAFLTLLDDYPMAALEIFNDYVSVVPEFRTKNSG